MEHGVFNASDGAGTSSSSDPDVPDNHTPAQIEQHARLTRQTHWGAAITIIYDASDGGMITARNLLFVSRLEKKTLTPTLTLIGGTFSL